MNDPRLYRAACPHASWWVLVDREHATEPELPVQCPIPGTAGCGILWARSWEPR